MFTHFKHGNRMSRQSDLPGNTWQSWNFQLLPSFLPLAIRLQTNNAYTLACRHLLTIQDAEIVQRKQKKPLAAIPFGIPKSSVEREERESKDWTAGTGQRYFFLKLWKYPFPSISRTKNIHLQNQKYCIYVVTMTGWRKAFSHT